jgi:NAD(P)-dependent dehydrogenase (short-subunit alcohol dehydrogenase family)
MQRLEGRVAVITGAGSGIGLATARRFASEGATVVAVDVNTDAGRAAADEVGGEFVECDVADEDAVRDLFDGVFERHDRLDIAFNNAGISPPDDDSILETGLEAWERVLRVNTTSVYLCCKYALPHMRARQRGSIINTASFVALVGAATSQIAYTASKGGVLAMTRELGVQFAREGIRVNALCPGPIATPLLMELFAKDPERAARRHTAPAPARRDRHRDAPAEAGLVQRALGPLRVRFPGLQGVRRHRRGELVPPPGGRRSGTADGHRLGRRRRDRGGRGPGDAVRPRGPVASGAGG